MTGKLYIVATPIGNLQDITLRALTVLKEVDLILAEDTRRTRPLMSHFAISNQVISYFEYSPQHKEEKILQKLREGENIALVTDAGTPALSDPGARLVFLARQNGVAVEAIPGPSAFLAAISIAGYPAASHHFWGFLPIKKGKRKKIYEHIRAIDGLHGFFESTHKILKRVDEWREYFSDYSFFIGKEMTKKFETQLWGNLAEVADQLLAMDVRGEFTILLTNQGNSAEQDL